MYSNFINFDTNLPSGPEPQVMLLSASSSTGLTDKAQNLRHYLEQQNNLNTDDLKILARTYAIKNSHEPYRIAFSAVTKQILQQELSDYLNTGHLETLTPVTSVNTNKLLFVFSGHGAQYIKTAQELYSNNPIFKRTADFVNARFVALENFAILERIFNPPRQLLPNQFQNDHQVTFFLQVCLAAFLIELGIKPTGVLGHSMGEYAAAVVAKVISLDAGIKLISKRGDMVQQITGKGRTIAITASEEVIREKIKKYKSLEIAAINSPTNVTVSGEGKDIQELYDELDSEQIYSTILVSAVAAHSSFMAEFCPIFKEFAQQFAYHEPDIDYFSTTEGCLKTDGFNAQYWSTNLRLPVQFSKAIAAALKMQYQIWIEVDPYPVLNPYLKENLALASNKTFVITTFNKDNDDAQQIARCFADLYDCGVTEPIINLFAKEPLMELNLVTSSPTSAEQLNNTTVNNAVTESRLTTEQINQVVTQTVTALIRAIKFGNKTNIMLDPDHPLVDQGMRSLIALQISTKIKNDLGVQITPRAVFQKDMTLTKLITLVAEAYQQTLPYVQSTRDNPYLEVMHEDNTATFNIICFMNLGGGALFYKPLLDVILERNVPVNMYFFQIDTSKFGSQPEKFFDMLMDKWLHCFQDIAKKSGKNIFIGHSLGALLAIELAERLKNAQAQEPNQLILANCFPINMRDMYIRPMLYEQSLTELIQSINFDKYLNLSLDDTMKLFKQKIELCLELLRHEKFSNSISTTIPVSLYYSKADPLWAEWQQDEWSKYSKLAAIEISGDHFAIAQHWELVVQNIIGLK